jgi:SNF2 family DNA or RNA helicase
MRLTALPDRLRLLDTDAAHSARFGAIPGARWNKSLMCWEYPRSPFAAREVLKVSERKKLDCAFDHGALELLTKFDLIMDAKKWKGKDWETWEIWRELYLNWKAQTKPWAHQQRAAEFIKPMEAAYLALDMGTGKTLVAINEILETEAQQTLIISPLSVLDVWVDEFKIHCSEARMPHVCVLTKPTTEGKAKEAKRAQGLAGAEGRPLIVLVNYESAWRGELGAWLLGQHWDMVILDEAHKCKGNSTQVSRWAARLHHSAARRLCLSGTPLPNNQLDAFGQYRFLDPALFGSNFTKFKAKYCRMGGYGGYEITEWLHQDEFKMRMDAITFRVDKSVLDLPSTMCIDRYCTLEPDSEAARVYRDVKNEFVADVQSGVVTAANALTRLFRLQQITSGFVGVEGHGEQWLGDHKRDLLHEVLEGIDPSEPVVVFCRFRRDLESVRYVAEKLGRSWGELSGERNDLVAGKLPEGIKVLGVQIQAGGLGVNLIAARYCVFYSVGFSLADYEQAKARVHRGGQTRAVTYVNLIAKGTVDRQVYHALAEKKEAVDEIMDAIKRGEV